MYIDTKQFIKDYLFTAAWVTCDVDENWNFDEDGEEIARYECLLFISLVIEAFGAEAAQPLLTAKGKDLTYLAPHDFFLTRNGHGAGFWDKPEMYGGQENADKLTEIATRLGSSDCYHINGPQSELTFEKYVVKTPLSYLRPNKNG